MAGFTLKTSTARSLCVRYGNAHKNLPARNKIVANDLELHDWKQRTTFSSFALRGHLLQQRSNTSE